MICDNETKQTTGPGCPDCYQHNGELILKYITKQTN